MHGGISFAMNRSCSAIIKTKGFMSDRQIKNNYPNRMSIPIEFGTDLSLYFQIKQIQSPKQSQNSMNHSTIISEKPLIPGLFQIAACAHDIESASMLKSTLARERTPLSEAMLDPKKLEAILKGIARRKKFSARRASAGRFDRDQA